MTSFPQMPPEILEQILCSAENLGTWPNDRVHVDNMHNWQLVCKAWYSCLVRVVVEPDSLIYLAWHATEPVLVREMTKLAQSARLPPDQELLLTLIYSTASRGYIQAVHFLLEQGHLTPDTRELASWRILEVAAASNSNTLFDLVLDREPDLPSSMTLRAEPLEIAAKSGHMDMVKRFLALGLPVDRPDMHHHCAIAWAAEEGQEEIVGLLLARQASRPNQIADYHNAMAMVSAAQEGHEGVVRLLMEHHVDVNAASIYNRPRSAISQAACNGHDNVVRILLENGVDVRGKSEPAQEPLLFAGASGSRATVEVLLAHGADVNTSEFGDTPLNAAVEGCSADIVRVLIEHGADINRRSKYDPPLVRAALNGDMETAELLLAHGADVNAIAYRHERCGTALAAAVLLDNVPMTARLLDAGARADFPRDVKRTALDLARGRKHGDICKMLGLT